MARRQKLVLGVLEHFLQDSAQTFANSICDDLGIPWDELENTHLPEFASVARSKLEPLLGSTKANFVGGVIEKLKERGV